MERRIKALVIAEAANPEWVSVPLVGWSLAHALREVADVHIVTQVRNREAVLRAGLVEGRDFTAIDSEALAAPMWRLAERLSMGKGVGWTIKTAVSTLGYGYFERLIWRQFGDRIRAGEFDIVHRVTPLTPTANSLLAPRCKRAGVPFLIGPINGGVPWPKGFAAEQRREKELLSYFRGFYRYNPARGRMLRASAAILCGSRFALAEIPAKHAAKTVYMPENAIDPARFNLVAPQDGRLPLRACFIGRLVPLKGVDMAIQAAAPLLRDGRLHFDIVGDGPQAEDLKALARSLQVDAAVSFHGWKEHHEVQALAAQSQLLIFPSIREFGGGVVLEAMALGVVPVIADYAGPGELVDDASGFRIPMGDRPEIVARLGECLQAIADRPDMLPAMAAAARARVLRDFTWPAKARQIERIWRAVLAGGPLPQEMPVPR